MSEHPTIFADTESGSTVWIRVEGKGSFQNSGGLKDFSRQMIASGRRDFVVDLSDCPAMDSTFMGTLAGIALRLREANGGRLWVTNRNDRNEELLAGLGLDALFASDPLPECGQRGTACAVLHATDKTATRTVMREAHEDAVRANPDNAVRFKAVIDHLNESERRERNLPRDGGANPSN